MSARRAGGEGRSSATPGRPAPEAGAPAGALWDAVVGQSQAVELLRRAVATGRIAHAYAFLGPVGVGRRLVACGLAQACLCAERGCGRCRTCRRVAAGIHPDCQVIAPTAPRDNPRGAVALRIEQVRELEHRAALAPFEGPWKVFILDDADHMTLPTAQALLKTLEEPPPRTILILILANPRALPPTVLSRCQRVRFRPLGPEEAAALLRARGAAPETAHLLARLSRGQVGLVEGTALETLRAERAAALALLDVPGPGLAPRLDELQPDRARVAAWLDTYWLWYRDALCLAAGADEGLLVHGDRREDLATLVGRVPLATLAEAVRALKEAWLALEGNVSPRLVLEATLLRLAAPAA